VSEEIEEVIEATEEVSLEIIPKFHGELHSLDIGGVPFNIRFQDQLFVEGDECDGVCHGAREEIEISSRMAGHRQARTLFHEIIHACFVTGGISQILKEDVEEAIVQCLEYKLWPIVDFRPEIKDRLEW